MKVFAISDLHLSFSCDKPMNVFGGAWENYLQEIEQSWNELVSDDDKIGRASCRERVSVCV